MSKKGKGKHAKGDESRGKHGKRWPWIAAIVVVLAIIGSCNTANRANSDKGSNASETAAAQQGDRQAAANGNEANDDQGGAEGREQPAPAGTSTSFDPAASTYEGLKLEVTTPKAGPYKAIVTVCGNGEGDFQTMRQCITDAAAYYGLAEDADTVGAQFDSTIGSEGGSGSTWGDGGVITSAPNGTETTYKAELYVSN